MNQIGLKTEMSDKLVIRLNDLLANYQVYYMNVRGLHWNIKGPRFFEMHVKFEELYNDLLLKVDELAERVRTLGGMPTHSYGDYLKVSEIMEVKGVTDDKEAVRSLLEGFVILLVKQREILDMSGEANDEGTSSMMSDYIREQEKLVWMYSAYLADEPA